MINHPTLEQLSRTHVVWLISQIRLKLGPWFLGIKEVVTVYCSRKNCLHCFQELKD